MEGGGQHLDRRDKEKKIKMLQVKTLLKRSHEVQSDSSKKCHAKRHILWLSPYTSLSVGQVCMKTC